MKFMSLKSFIAVSAVCLVFTTAAGAVVVNTVSRNIADGVQVSTMTFDMAFSSDSFKLSNQYIQLYYESYTGLAWNAAIYTKNPASVYPNPDHGRSGLVGTTYNTVSVPLAWKKSDVIWATPTTGVPNGSTWNWINNKDTETSVLPASATILSSSLGNPSQATYYIYLEGNFYGASAADYGSSIWVDLFQTVDSVAPYIAHAPVSSIVSIGNDLLLQATVTDDTAVMGCSLYYKLDNGPWVQYDGVASSGTQTSKYYQFSLPAETIGSAAQISYCITATDGYNFAVFGGNGVNRDQTSLAMAVALGETTPQVITVGTQITFPPLTSGTLIVPDGNPNDGNTSITIPDGALTSPAAITITQLDSNNASNARQGPSLRAGSEAVNIERKPLAAYQFAPENLLFHAPVNISLLFLADSKGVIRFPNGKVFAGIKKSDLKVFWWDGFDWRIIGGRLDEKNNTITIKTTESLGRYAIFYQPPLNASDYRPKEKIITPNGDNKNDYALFGNLDGQDYSINIFDINGHKVKTIDTSSLPRWDGTDDGGRVVESGVYLYQFKAQVDGGMKLISGTIVVAK